ncbi:MAG: xylanase, partial [Acidithiobacillus sp.]
ATYHNLGKAYSRMSELLRIFEFTSFSRYITENKMIN